MSDFEKTVFISYRREAAAFIARAIFMDLRSHGFDVFMDIESMDSGWFDTTLLDQIATRRHFIVILTPGTLERCVEPQDWVRREIEHAIDTGRNIVPLLVNSFTFVGADVYLTGNLAELKRYNSVTVPIDFFDEAMKRLRKRFLKPVTTPLRPPLLESRPPEPVISTSEQAVVQEHIEEIASQPTPTRDELSAEYHFGVGYELQEQGRFQEAINHYSEAIRRNPGYRRAYYNRGLTYQSLKELDNAERDYLQALEIEPDNAKTHHNLGVVWSEQQRYTEAIEALNRAITLKPDYAIAYLNRCAAKQAMGDEQGAHEDYQIYQQFITALSDELDASESSIVDELSSSSEINNSDGVDQSEPAVTDQPTDPLTPENTPPPLENKPVGALDLFRRLFAKTEDELNGRFTPDSATQPLPPPASKSPFQFIPDSTTRPLQPERPYEINNHFLQFGMTSDVGMVRTNNQDTCGFFVSGIETIEEIPYFGCFIVSDGMGGHHDGEKASAVTTRVVTQLLTDQVYKPLLSQTSDPDRPTIIESMIAAVQKANSEVMSCVPEGGATITAALIVDDLVYLAHVGDTRAYLITQDGIEQVTRDHSLVQRLIELGKLTPEEAVDHPQKNVLYRAIGQIEMIEVDTLTRRLPPGSYLLLCSDGLWAQVPSAELRQTVLENTPQDACAKLVKLANERGGTDNISVIIVKFPGDLSATHDSI